MGHLNSSTKDPSTRTAPMSIPQCHRCDSTATCSQRPGKRNILGVGDILHSAAWEIGAKKQLTLRKHAKVLNIHENISPNREKSVLAHIKVSVGVPKAPTGPKGGNWRTTKVPRGSTNRIEERRPVYNSISRGGEINPLRNIDRRSAAVILPLNSFAQLRQIHINPGDIVLGRYSPSHVIYPPCIWSFRLPTLNFSVK